MEKQLKCQICQEQFTEENFPRLIPKCGHSFCTKCYSQNIAKQKGSKFQFLCPNCHQVTILQKNNINHFPKNISLFRMMQTTLIRKEAQALKELSINESKILKHDQHQQDLKDILNSIIYQTDQATSKTTTSCEQLGVSRKNESISLQSITFQNCQSHNKKLQLLCLQHMMKICSNCALFGDHKNHQIKTIQDFMKQAAKKAEIILQLFTKISVFTLNQHMHQKYNQQYVQNQLKYQLTLKKQQITQEIVKYYAKLTEMLKKEEKQNLERVEEIFSDKERSFKKKLQLPEKVSIEYKNWNKKSQELLSMVTADNLTKIQQLVELMANDKESVQRGENLFLDIEKYYEGVLFKIQSEIEEISVEKKQNHENFCSISEGFKKQNCKQKLKKQGKFYKSSNKSTHILLNPIQQQIKQNYKPFDNQDLLLQLSQSINNSKARKSQPNRETADCQFTIQKFIDTIKPTKNILNTSCTNIKLLQYPLKRKKCIKVPLKYQTILQDLKNQRTELIDFTNAQLGDSVIVQICEYVKINKKVKSLKLIRNKISDECISTIITAVRQTNINSLNLSQNFLSDNIIDYILQNYSGQYLKVLTLSQNKINHRNVKGKIEKIKKLGLQISL